MPRSRYLYLVFDNENDLVAGFTVKWERDAYIEKYMKDQEVTLVRLLDGIHENSEVTVL
jgi:hypothetical protein